MQPIIRQFDPGSWATCSARLIQERIEVALKERGRCRVMLTGGRSAERLYMAWAENASFPMAGTEFYFGDERCVPPSDPESNYGMVMRSLFRQGIAEGCSVHRMEAEAPDIEAAALRYEGNLPEEIDVLLLGVGEDGHIASLFPGSDVLKNSTRKVVHVFGPKPPHHRMTITPTVIAKAKSIFVLAAGPAKAQVLAKAAAAPCDVDAMPVRLVLKATWMLDTQEL